MNIIFCHGLESAPHGRKFTALRASGLDIDAPDFRGMNLRERVHHLLNKLTPGAVVVGSSYGGVAALCAAIVANHNGLRLGGLLLCAPALARNEPPASTLTLRVPALLATTIIHGVRDSVVPIESSRQLADLDPHVRLIEVPDDHALVDAVPLVVSETHWLVDSARARADGIDEI